jgi:thiamine kinase-like enzyme
LAQSATACLRREYATLVQLADEGRDIAPRPLRADTETRFTAQTYLHGRSAGTTLGEAHVDFLSCLVQSERSITLEAVRDQLQAQRDKLEAAGQLSPSARETVDSTLNQHSWSGSVPLVRSHGDFAPWNLKRCPDGRIRAVDWEDSSADELPYFDLYHYARSVSEQLGRRSVIPWAAYTSALMHRDPKFSTDSVVNLRAAAGLTYWMRRGCQDDWNTDIHAAA